MMAKYRPVEGGLYGLPLDCGKYAGLLVGARGHGPRLLVHVVSESWDSLPTVEQVGLHMRRARVIFSGITGPLGIQDGSWPFIGRMEGYSRSEWLCNELYNRNMDRVALVDPQKLTVVSRRPVASPVERDLPLDAAYGHVVVQTLVSRILCPANDPKAPR
jgi:hypothetical protein